MDKICNKRVLEKKKHDKRCQDLLELGRHRPIWGQVSRYQLATDSWTEVPTFLELQPSSRSFVCFYKCVSVITKSL